MAAPQVPVRVRFAPSPTGHLHIGGARTALFNFLFARSQGGAFILRIEDTDQERSTPESTRGILDSLRWLGLDWDEGPESGGEHGPYFQSERRPLYREEARKLLDSGRAYHCYCTPEELAQRREEARLARRPTSYDGRCRGLTAAQREERERRGIVPAVRLVLRGGTTSWVDLIHGEVTFDNSELEDFVILKGDGFPTYNFAVVVDDARMEISHVIRGDDHISNTPRNILIYEALELPAPRFAHVPMILGPDGARLSKRHGATAIGQYREEGFIPEAMVNYLALLGWSTPESRQTFTMPELISEFDLYRVSKNAVIFDPEKLRWLNNYHIQALPVAERTERLLPFWEREGLDARERDLRWLEKVVEVVGDRVKTLTEIGRYTEFLFREVTPEEADEKVLRQAEPLIPVLRRVTERLKSVEPFERDRIEEVIREEAAAAGIKVGKIIQPLRVAVTGRRVSPGLFESLELVGKEKVLARLHAAWPETM